MNSPPSDICNTIYPDQLQQSKKPETTISPPCHSNVSRTRFIFLPDICYKRKGGNATKNNVWHWLRQDEIWHIHTNSSFLNSPPIYYFPKALHVTDIDHNTASSTFMLVISEHHSFFLPLTFTKTYSIDKYPSLTIQTPVQFFHSFFNVLVSLLIW